MKITFFPKEITVDVPSNTTILQAAKQAGVSIPAPCGGLGSCGKCKVSVRRDKWKDFPSSTESVLACKTYVQDGMCVEVPREEKATQRKGSGSIGLPEGFRPDLPENFRDAPNYGLAVDIGTTTVVVMLWDLRTGENIGCKAFTNPQGMYGADVLSRITYAMQKREHCAELQRVLVEGINLAVRELTEDAQIVSSEIHRAVVVGNTAMSALFAMEDVSPLAAAPFTGIYQGGKTYRAESLGLLIAEDAEVYVAPNLAGHVGSDLTAGLLVLERGFLGNEPLNEKKEENVLLLDIGTNGELVLCTKDRILAASTAAGPAFEGSMISSGMRASDGAIEHVWIGSTDEAVKLRIIGKKSPTGICGSGIIDAIAELLKSRVMDRTGRICSEEELEEYGLSEDLIQHVRNNGRINDFVLTYGKKEGKEILLTQKDIREVQLAKAAIAAGISVMEQKISNNAPLDRIYIAGAFGSYIRMESAIRMGLLPKISLEQVNSIGNAAGIGCSMMLLSDKEKRKAEALASRVEYVSLAEEPGFQDCYIDEMNFVL